MVPPIYTQQKCLSTAAATTEPQSVNTCHFLKTADVEAASAQETTFIFKCMPP